MGRIGRKFSVMMPPVDPAVSPLSPDSQGVDPALVPQKTLFTNARMPAIGLGTFGSDSVTDAQIADAILGAARVGYRHFDCASVYGNEALVGRSLTAIQAEGVAREDLWVTSKLWNDRHGPGQVAASCEQSLSDLQLDYLDLYLVHWPFPNFHAKGVDASARDPHAQAYIHDYYMQTWRQMEALVDRGLVRHIGTSNMTVPKLELVLRDARIRPAANEMELHPHFQQPELFQYVTNNGMVPIGYSPIGSPARPERDKTPGDTADIDDPVLGRIAARLSIHPATLCVKWAVQRGQVPIPFSTNPRNYLANLQAAVSPPLSAQEMGEIAQLDKNCRLIKGHVFLWKDNQTWEDLWDRDGTITPP